MGVKGILKLNKKVKCQFFWGLVLSILLPVSSNAQDLARVKRVIDGDTLLLANGEKVRLIGVDTPEKNHPQKPVQRFANEAYLFTKRMAEGKEVKLEYDRQKKDRHGRVSAYVYLLDGTFSNAEIIKQGYGFAYTKYPFKFLNEFRGYEREARENGRGLWK